MHSPSLLFLLALLLGIMALTLFAVWAVNRRIEGQAWWVGAFFASFYSSLNFLLRPHLAPGSLLDIMAIVSAQLSSFLTAYLLLHGLRRYLGRPPPAPAVGLLASVALVAGILHLTLVDPSPTTRVMVQSAVSGTLFTLCALTIARGDWRRYPARYLLALPCAFHGVFLLGRTAAIGLGLVGPLDIRDLNSIPPLLIIEATITLVSIAFGTLMLINERITDELRTLAEKDGLTKILNRRSFLDALETRLRQARLNRTPLCVLLIDLDHFKVINDTWGHSIGDAVLCHFVDVASSCIRTHDGFGRLGGEEFALFLPASDLDNALPVAERLRARIAATPLATPHGPISLTVSIGIAQSLPDETPDSLLHRADMAMYRAKEKGRNRVDTDSAAPLPCPAANPGDFAENRIPA